MIKLDKNWTSRVSDLLKDGYKARQKDQIINNY